MTIVQRIQLHKLGYTKEEINELAKADFDPDGLENPPMSVEETQIEQDPAPERSEVTAPDGQATNDAILKALQGLTATIQQSNIIASRQPEQPKETAEDVLFNML